VGRDARGRIDADQARGREAQGRAAEQRQVRLQVARRRRVLREVAALVLPRRQALGPILAGRTDGDASDERSRWTTAEAVTQLALAAAAERPIAILVDRHLSRIQEPRWPW